MKKITYHNTMLRAVIVIQALISATLIAQNIAQNQSLLQSDDFVFYAQPSLGADATLHESTLVTSDEGGIARKNVVSEDIKTFGNRYVTTPDNAAAGKVNKIPVAKMDATELRMRGVEPRITPQEAAAVPPKAPALVNKPAKTPINSLAGKGKIAIKPAATWQPPVDAAPNPTAYADIN